VHDLPTIGSHGKIPHPDHPDATLHDLASEQFGDYQLLREIGRGGMGVVYLARQQKPNRLVALKMLLPHSLPSDEDLQRFRTEAEATAHLQHAGIVRVFEVGEHGGRHFFSMEYIDGLSLAQKLTQGPLAARTAATYVLAIARAIQHAHDHGILHRDLKPSNVLLDSEDQPHVTDFGVAKRLNEERGQTRTGSILGTPSYMPPEQASGRVRDLKPTSDVYSLGAVLYELLTGRPPFRAETAVDTIMQVLEQDPVPPRLLNARLDRDLETICLKALEKEVEHRYASAADLADDLEHYLAGEPISVRSLNVFDRLSRTLDRMCDSSEVDFPAWSQIAFWFAAILLCADVIIFALTLDGPPYPHAWVVSCRVAQFSLMALVFWKLRGGSMRPSTLAERQLLSIWVGYLAACFVAFAMMRTLHGQALDELTLFPIWMILSGLAFYAMGASYWGHAYTFGTIFFVAAILMTLHLHSAPLVFGALWAIALVSVGVRLRRLGQQEESQK
jgi:serine/threonine-protein kinase